RRWLTPPAAARPPDPSELEQLRRSVLPPLKRSARLSPDAPRKSPMPFEPVALTRKSTNQARHQPERAHHGRRDIFDSAAQFGPIRIAALSGRQRSHAD